jgi:hypothetical protein
MIENIEKVDTCQLEIQKNAGHLWKDRLVIDPRSGRSSGVSL